MSAPLGVQRVFQLLREAAQTQIRMRGLQHRQELAGSLVAFDEVCQAA